MIRDSCRIGISKGDSVRPVKFTLSSSEHVVRILRNAKKLRDKDGYESVYICPDRPIEERAAYKKLVEELKRKRDQESNKVHYIRNNKIVSSSRDSVPAVAGKT